ncbi:hypothetical protein [Aquabacterium sp.]|uniref:hypothetical protein n=1 Tax=Aquabacterium sp. TaxID=1872578 RepID=UPI00378432D4
MSKTASAAVEQAAEQAAGKASQMIESTRHAANHTLDQLDQRVDALRDAAPSVWRQAGAQVEDLTRRGIDRAREASLKVRDKVVDTHDRSVAYIRDEPVKSVVIAAAAGATLAALIGWLARSRHSQSGV